MKTLLTIILIFTSAIGFSQYYPDRENEELLYKKTNYAFDLGLRGTLLVDRFGVDLGSFVTLNSGIEIKDLILLKGFIGLTRDPYLGGEFGYNATWNVPGQIDVILGVQGGYYQRNFSLSLPHIQTRFKLSDNATTSVLISPNYLSIRLGIITSFK